MDTDVIKEEEGKEQKITGIRKKEKYDNSIKEKTRL